MVRSGAAAAPPFMPAFRLLCITLFWIAILGAQTRSEIDAIAKDLAEITGLKLKKPIPSSTIDRAGLKTFLEQQIKESVKPDEIRAEELTLKKFGLVPQDFDLAKSTVELMTEQAAAFYDYRKKKLYLLESTANSDLAQTALVHELAHALADQHFHLDKYIRGASQTDDGSLARIAVMEGQATWIMTEYMLRKTGMSLKNSPAMSEMAAREGESGTTGAYPVLEGAPLYLRESLIFPYTQGMRFQQKVIERLGTDGFSEVFRRAPITTQQILHPERYFEGTVAPRPKLPAFPDSKHYKELTNGGVGEFDHRVLLEQYAGKAVSADVSPKWRSGYYRLYERRSDKRIVLSYATTWEDEAAAVRYFGVYRMVLAGKWKKLQIVDDTGTQLTGEGDDGFFVLRCQGDRVSSVEGLATLDEARAAAQLN